MELRVVGLEQESGGNLQNKHPGNDRKGQNGWVSGRQRRKIFVANGFWWYEDSLHSEVVMLDPVFVKCGWQMGKLAKALGIGEKTLSRLVEYSLGIRGKTWLRQVRIVSIRRSLTAEVKIEAVATDFGFGQHSDLTREFRSLVGVTPSAFILSESRRRRALNDASDVSVFP